MVRIAAQTGDTLVVEAGDPAFARILLALSGICLGVAAVMLFAFARPWHTESFRGVVLGAVLFLAGFVAVFERATFEFDRAAGTLTWRRRRAFTTKSGLVPLREIREVVLQTAIGNAVNPKRRIALILPGSELPLSVGYAPDADGAARGLVEDIQRFIGNTA